MIIKCCNKALKLVSTDRYVGGNHLFFQCEKCGDVSIYDFNDSSDINNVYHIENVKIKLDVGK